MLENLLYSMRFTASKNAEAANFPFCTIDPNIGIDVIDERLDSLSKLSKSKKKFILILPSLI